MKFKAFTFKYLKHKSVRYIILALLIVFGIIVPFYYRWYWDNVKYKIEEKFKQKVYLYDINKNGDTIKDVLAVKDLTFKDSLITFYERRYNGKPDILNIPFVFLKGGPFPFIEYTSDSLVGKIIFASYHSPKFYEEYFVFKKSMHFINN